MAASDIEPEEVAQIEAYADEVRNLFGRDVADASARFEDSNRLLQRFLDAIDVMLANGRALISGVDEAHNELCVASKLLKHRDPQFTVLDYEPALAGSAKSIDFRATTADGITIYVDVKTIKPKPRDRWDQFEKARAEGWLPENVHVVLSEEWLGGELWHSMFAARSRMLEYALELEAKIRDCDLPADSAFFVLCLCGEGFHWRQNELEDFVAFYRSGSHRGDDAFSMAETKYMADKNIMLDRTITRFACMRRAQFHLQPERLNWNVQPPVGPLFGG